MAKGLSSPIVHLDEHTGFNLADDQEAWLKWRDGLKQASNAPIVMQVTPSYWETRTWQELRTPRDERPEPSEETKRIWEEGHRRERIWHQAHAQHLPSQVCVERDGYGATLDVADLDNPFGAVWWEVKSPTSRRSKIWTAMKDPSPKQVRTLLPYVWWQLVHQAHVVGDLLGVCYLVVTRPGGPGSRRVAIQAEMLLDDWPTLHEQWQLFESGGMPGQADDAWIRTASAYRNADSEYKAWEERRKRARVALLSLAAEHPDDKVRGGGVTVSTVRREGTIDYKTMAMDAYAKFGSTDEQFSCEAERYRRPSYETARITVERETQ